MLQWRNAKLDFASLGALQASLAMVPSEAGLTRAPVGEDILVLEHAARDEDVRALARDASAIERLWDACQVPDYRKIAPATHAELVVTLYGFLMREGNIPTDWFDRQLKQADRTEGDIDTLSNRIAHVRTWTFVANRPDWLADPEHWQGVTRAIEDKLSDALHERLAERFVDRRTSVLMRRLRENAMLDTEIGKTGEVVVEGHAIGRLDGFMFAPDASATAGSEAKALNAAAQKALSGEIEARATRLSQCANDQIVLANDGVVRWMGDAVGKLTAGDDALRPRLRVIADEHLTGPARELVQTRLDLWLKTYIEKQLAPLFSLSAAEDVTGMARGVAFQLVEALGVLERQRVSDEVKGLDQPQRATLRKYGVRFGAYHIYLPALLKPAPRALATQLWALKNEAPDAKGVADLLHLAASGRTSIPVEQETPKALYRTAGYRVCGDRAVRVDILERLADLIRPALSWREHAAGPKPDGAVDGRTFTVTGAMTSLTGASGEDFASILRALGYRMERRPKPPAAEKPAETETPATEASVEAPVEGTAEAAPETAATEAPETAGESTEASAPEAASVTDSEMMPEPAEAALETPAEAAPEAPAVEETVGAVPAEGEEAKPEETTVEATAEAPLEAPEAEAAVVAEGTAGDETVQNANEPEMIEVWRPGGRSERRPHRSRRPNQRAQQAAAPAEGGEAAAASGEAPAPAEGEPPRRHRQRRPSGAERQGREDRQDRQPRKDRDGGRGDRQGHQGRGDRPRRPRRDGGGVDRAEREKYFAKPQGGGRGGGGERRDKQPDPNSPFAKLAALKQQLEQDGKEGS